MSSVPCRRSVFFPITLLYQNVWWSRRSEGPEGLLGRFAGALFVGSLVPHVGLGDGPDLGMVAGLADGFAPRVGKPPLADINGKAEPGNQRSARQVRIFFIARDVGAGLFDQLLHDPRRNV